MCYGHRQELRERRLSTAKLTIDLDDLANDALVEVLIDTIPDMTSEELARLEIAINGELQDRSRQTSSFNVY